MTLQCQSQCQMLLLLLLLLPLLLQFAVAAGSNANRCEWNNAKGEQFRRFSALPGGGWDNLRNKDLGLVAELSFNDCSLADDGKYVLPSNVILYPRKESDVSVHVEVMEHYNNFTDSLTVTVNVGGHGIIHGIGIGGKFSEEYQRVKSIALHTRTRIARTSARYHLYSVKLQPDFTLSKAFKNRMVDIANAIINNQTKMARYLSDLVVRDFGTHFITSVEAGGVLEMRVFFDTSSITKRDFMQNKFSMSMSVDFFKIYGIDTSMTTTVTKEDIDVYTKSVKQRNVVTHGGPIMASKMNASAWEKQLLDNLVAIDRDGVPIYSAVTQRSLPEVPLPYMGALVSMIKKAVLRYYHANVVKGCQDPNSANFDPVANVDGGCSPPATNFSFGGIFQKCADSNPSAGLNACAGNNIVNPITGEFKCPDGYESVHLLDSTGVKSRRCWTKHRRCFLFFTCNDGQECVESTAMISTFWCAVGRNARLAQSSGMIYGGAYGKDFVNPVTNAASCLAYYRPYKIGQDISVCLSRDFRTAGSTRVPFAGFFSCRSGNPLAEPGRHIVSLKSSSSSSSSSLNSYPKRCPDSFSQMTLDIVEGCSLMVCEQLPRSPGRQYARQPPFESPTYKFKGAPVVQVTDTGRRWQFNTSLGSWFFAGFVDTEAEAKAKQAVEKEKEQPRQSAAAGATAGTVVAVLSAAVLVAVIAALVVRRRLRRRRRGLYMEAETQDVFGGSDNAGYRTIEEEQST